jgi:tetratricopeptide (TPR) repeat protein
MLPWLRILSVLGVFLAGATVPAQTRSAPPKPDRAAAYYHAALGHLYTDLAGQFGGRGEYVSKAIENFKLAMKADPESAYLAERIADLYLQSGQVRSGVSEFEDVVKRSPEDLNARRILGRLYTARLREGSQNRPNQEMLSRAIEQYEAVTAKAEKDAESWVMLGRLYKLSQKSPEAEKAYRKALDAEPNNEFALLGLAEVFSELGDNPRAAEMLKRVAEKNPNLRTLTALAASHEQMKEYKQAANAYKRALDANPDNTDLKRAYAQQLFQAEDWDPALAVFLELAEEDAKDVLAQLRLSQIYRQKREFAKAREAARKARELDPDNLEIRFNEVSLLEIEGKVTEAIAMLKEVIAGLPSTSTSQNDRGNRVILLERLGFLYRQAGQLSDAVAAYREIAQLDPVTEARALAQIVETYRAAKEFTQAGREAQTALDKHPNDRILKIVSANINADLGRFEPAVATLKSLLDGKSDRETWLSIAQIHEKARNYGEMAKAIDSAEKLASSDEDRETVFFLRGAMFEKMKKFEPSEAEFRKVLKINPQSAGALNYLGYMLADRNTRLNEALEMIKKAVDMDPQNGAYLDSLGWAYYRLERLDEAAENLRRAQQRTSRDPTIYDHLGDVYHKQGKLKEAIAQWERSVKEWQANAPAEIDNAEIAKVQKKLESGRSRLARETGAKK